MARMNNPAEMTIVEQIESAKEEVCDNICKIPVLVRWGELDHEKAEGFCDKECPLKKLSNKWPEDIVDDTK